MKIEEIPADTLVNMTEFWYKAFRLTGANLVVIRVENG